MALTLPTENQRAISFEEYLGYMDTQVDWRDEASIVASADTLRALANNRQFLTSYVNETLQNWPGTQTENLHSAQTLVLARKPHYAVRINAWYTESTSPEIGYWQRKYFYYGVPHDHSFSFMTVGYWGPGYRTILYERASDAHWNDLTEAELATVEDTTLPVGKVMFYRASRDVHIQLYPSAFSISLNLLVFPTHDAIVDQYIFERSCRRVIGVTPGTGGSGRVLLCRLAEQIGDDETKGALEKLATWHSTSSTRAQSLLSLAVLDEAAGDRIARGAADARCPLLARVARAVLERRTQSVPPILTDMEQLWRDA